MTKPASSGIDMELASIVITLKALALPPEGTELPAMWGQAAHALLLRVIEERNPALSARLHDEEGLKPFTASTLMGSFAQGKPDLKQAYWLRFTSLLPETSAILLEAVEKGSLSPGRQVELERLPFQVVGVATRPEESAWASLTSYTELSGSLLMAAQPAPRRINLTFSSPTTFKSGGKHLPVPLPELVFGSLLERWNAFAPVAFPPEARRYAQECLALARYDLSTRPVQVKGAGLRVGAVGQATYTTLNYDRYWMSLMMVLALFAQFSGVGAGTSQGLGQCRAT